MLIRRRTTSLLTVTQVEHAALSLELARHGPGETRLSPALSEAIEHHDDGWIEWDRAPGDDRGIPRGYRDMSLRDHLTILNRSVERSRRRHPYAGWLVSRHGCSFHEGKSGRAVETFLEEQRQLRKDLEGAIPPGADPGADFDRLQFTDALSLFVIDPWARTLNWDRSHPGPARIRPRGDRFLVEQEGWPRTPARFTVRTRVIPPGPYGSRANLARTIGAAPIRREAVILEGVSPA